MKITGATIPHALRKARQKTSDLVERVVAKKVMPYREKIGAMGYTITIEALADTAEKAELFESYVDGLVRLFDAEDGSATINVFVRSFTVKRTANELNEWPFTIELVQTSLAVEAEGYADANYVDPYYADAA